MSLIYLRWVHVLVFRWNLGDHLCSCPLRRSSKGLNITHLEHNLLVELRMVFETSKKPASFLSPDLGPSHIQIFRHPGWQPQTKLLHQWSNFVSRASVNFRITHRDDWESLRSLWICCPYIKLTAQSSSTSAFPGSSFLWPPILSHVANVDPIDDEPRGALPVTWSWIIIWAIGRAMASAGRILMGVNNFVQKVQTNFKLSLFLNLECNILWPCGPSNSSDMRTFLPNICICQHFPQK